MNNQYIPHIIKEGSKDHVISYNLIEINGKKRSIRHCNIPNCVINKEYDKYLDFFKRGL